MPASSGDPISAALNHSLAASSKFSNDSDNLDTKLIGSAKRVLVTEIKYEETSSYNNNVFELKSKYIVLKPATNLENGEVKLKNGVAKVKEGPTDAKLCVPNNCSKTITVSTKSPLLSNGSNKSEVVLPSPKKVLFPPEKIQLGWQSKSFPIGSGMINMGNTCYLNSTLQALFHVPAFVNWILNDKAHKDSCENTTSGPPQSECLICAMLKTLRNSMENSASSNSIRPHLVYNKLKLVCKRLIHGHQEDAHEFLRYLIESMDRSYLRFMQANNLDSYSKETTPLSQIFGGYLRTEVTCLECHNISLTFQHFQDLLLDIRQSSTLDEALQAYFSRERLGDGEEAYKCEKCHKRVAATKQFAVEKPPNVLCIQLKRFGIMGGKNSKHIQVQQSLDLTRFWVHRTKQPSSRLNYKMVSLVSHIGPSSNCGHYTAIGQTSSGQFYLFDDSVVRPVSPHAVSGTNTYIIMYELSSTNPSINGTPTKMASENCTITKSSQASSSTSSSSGSKIGGPNPFAKRPPSPVVNGAHSPNKSHISNPLKAILSSPTKPNYSGSSSCTKIVQASAQAGHKSLVPYSTESSDSESEATSTSKQKVSLALTPVKNGYAKENSSSAKYSNCTSSATSYKTSTLNGSCKSETVSDVVVNGWHVTAVTQRSPSDTSYSLPQNWNVVDTSDIKSSEKSESKPNTTVHCNGINGKDIHRKPLENGHISATIGPVHTTTVSSRVDDNGRVSNGKVWEGNRNNGTVDTLRKNSHQGYGSNVTSWSGSRSQVDREAVNDRLQQRKRSYDQMYDEDLDHGKMKKIKQNSHYQMKTDREMNGRRNLFQEHQNHKNNWFGDRNDRNNFYRTYSNNHYRTYQNNNRNPNYHWRRN